MKILVTGADGQLGQGINSYWNKQWNDEGRKENDVLLFMGKKDLDVTSVTDIKKKSLKKRPPLTW